MSAWLEVVEPKGADRELDPQRDFYVGRKASNDLVVALPALAESQFIVRYEKESWRLIDLHGTPSSRILVNDARMADRHRLQDGDVVRIHGLRVRFREERAAPTHTFEALRADPDDDTLWRVHADELQDRGDAFGEYLARALRGETPDRAPWLDDVFRRESIYGSLTLTWRRGVIESAVMRRRGARDTWDLALFRLLVQARVGQFLRHLHIDAGTPDFAMALATLDALPPTLETLQLGYQLGAVFRAHPAPPALKQRCPRLREAPVFFTTPGVKLRGDQQTLVLSGPCRLVRTPEGRLSLAEDRRSSVIAGFSIDEGGFTFSADGSAELNAGHGRRPVRLLLGDELVLRTGERLRVEPNEVDTT